MNAHDVLRIADELAGFGRTPADSCVAHDAGRPVGKALACLNCQIGDLLLARELGCDTVLVHHPLAGPARREFHRVLGRMVELMTEQGVSGERAIRATERLRERCRFNDHASDWDHLVSGARLLGLNLLNAHLAPDELGRRIMVDAVRDVTPHQTVRELMAALRTIPELAHEANSFIEVPDDPMRQCGRIAVMHGGGTNGGADVAEALFDAGVGTVLYIHLSGDDAMRLRHRAEAGGLGGVLVTGHLASDAIGLNVYLAELEKRGIELVRHGGLGTFAPG
ncbi:MAG: hypothetical protein Tsb0013_05600 [Phycisphaerales bacterium]